MIPFCANLRQGIEREVYFLVVQVYYLTNGGENGLFRGGDSMEYPAIWRICIRYCRNNASLIGRMVVILST